MTKSVRANQTQDFKKINQKEQFVLKVSMYCALILAIFGIGFGIFVKSMAVIFDGFVALISVALGILSVLTSSYIYKEDDEIFQYGYGRFEPMVNLFKSLILVLVCVYALFDALHSLLNGGYKVALGGAAVYSACAFIFCAILFTYTHFYTRKLDSDLIRVDNAEWRIDCVLYLGALVAFGTIWLCSFWEFAWQKEFAFYIDPALLALLSLALIFTPLRIAVANFKDLIMVAPLELDERITKIMEDLSKEFDFSDYDTHVAKSGRFYMVEVNILMQKNFQVKSLNEFDLIRERIEKALEIPSYKIWLSVSFTADKKWL
ncbi:cation diffusion facilitator family transporter [Campylobacter vulpis]|uniref:Cation diffusion facilitator family transporter n=1 Tax=Campylobacter vulpis TaxID=1655500 RepID=A0A2G4R3U8_9BACT|nr:cation diffusion facilitator family transporter [Campylobacter vulpis]MBS4331619.1 cation diffusion facilitator family transporter [Campylobacter vulpis]MBS4407090.1 cation diffusion facilitator family transporter [Campylobacter vulpis]MBS4439632.1 cation diffusion facilitator family transporter [Campylobacter vulpis]PHY91242.1 cation diffusion facilitator family transporter [Campylobacter vulpis]